MLKYIDFTNKTLHCEARGHKLSVLTMCNYALWYKRYEAKKWKRSTSGQLIPFIFCLYGYYPHVRMTAWDVKDKLH